jgi:hypothetical protein
MQRLCHSLLYAPPRPGESEADRLRRRLAFKLPVATRYSLLFGTLAGLLHAVLARRPRRLLQHLLATPLYVLLLCQEEARVLLLHE